MPDLPKSMWTFPAIVRIQAQKYGDRPFCTFFDGSALSFKDLDEQTDAIASALAAMGVEVGDRVMGLLHNGREFLLTMIAVHKRGAIFVPINVELKGGFLLHQMKTTEPKVVFVDAELRPAFDSFEMGELRVETTVMVGSGGEPLRGSKLLAFDPLTRIAARKEDLAEVSPYDACLIIFTSGTTGPAKGVLMPQAHCYYYALSAMNATALSESDCMYISMPFFHGTANLLQFYSCLLSGARVHVAKRFSASTWLSDVRSSGATVTYAVGVMPEFILKQAPTPQDKDNALRLIWSVPVSEKWGPEFEERFGLRILQGYGMTEFSVAVWGDLKDGVIAGCAGKVVERFFELRIVDPETDEPVPTGETGEIVVRPKEPGVFMQGYYRMPEKTLESVRNLWFHSGDAGYLDDQGRLFYVDRIRDRIRRRGENISSFEIEEVISNHPDVAQCAVVGVKVEGAGGEDEVMAYVVPQSAALTPQALSDWCAPRMPRYALPRFIEFVDEIQRTSTGKIMKQALRNAGVTDKTWDCGAAPKKESA